MASVEVFGSPTTPDVALVLTCLFEKDVEFDLIYVHDDDKVPESPLFPMSEFCSVISNMSEQLLLFQEGSANFMKTMEICRHIAEKYAEQGNKDLLGSNAHERGKTESFLFDVRHIWFLHIAATTLFLPNPEEEYKDLVGYVKHRLQFELDMFETVLEDTEYLVGDSFTLADLCFLPSAHYIITNMPECAALYKERKNVSRWWDEISSRPSWRRVVEMM